MPNDPLPPNETKISLTFPHNRLFALFGKARFYSDTDTSTSGAIWKV